MLAFLLYPNYDMDYDQFMQKDIKTNKYKLIFIGNNRCLVPGVLKNEQNGELKINVKCLLFCMDFMNEKIPDEIVKKFSNMDCLSILQSWQQELFQLNKENLIKQE